jgi:hypothetical protein
VQEPAAAKDSGRSVPVTCGDTVAVPPPSTVSRVASVVGADETPSPPRVQEAINAPSPTVLNIPSALRRLTGWVMVCSDLGR